MGRRLRLGIAGACLALAPALTPLLGLALARQRPRLRGRWAAWLAAAALLGAPAVVRGENPVFFWSGLFGLIACLGGWALATRRPAAVFQQAVGIGLTLGLALTAVLTTVQLASGIPRPVGFPWIPHANDLGHQTVVLSAIAMVLTGSVALRGGAWTIGMLIAVTCGSRAAMVGMAGLGLWLLLHTPGRRRKVMVFATAVALVAAGLTLLPTGRRVVPSLSLALRVLSGEVSSPFPANLLLDGDDLRSGAWLLSGALVEPLTSGARNAPASNRDGWLVRKRVPGAQAGIRQRVTLRPDTSYVFTVEMKPSEVGQRPGVVAVHGTDAERLFLVVADGDSVVQQGSAAVEVLGADVEPLSGGWVRQVVRFHVSAAEPGSAYIGPVVDARNGSVGAALALREPQLTVGTHGRPFALARSEDWAVGASADSLLARWGYWLAGWRGFLDHPLVGSSLAGYAQRYQDGLAPSDRGNTVPTHPHNLVLSVAYDGGAVGLLGLALLLIVLYLGLAAGPERSIAVVSFWLVLAIDLVDFTFFFGGVLYPLAALAGWQAGRSGTSAAPPGNSRPPPMP